MYLSKKSQVLIWQGNFHLPTTVCLQIYSLSCTHGKLKDLSESENTRILVLSLLRNTYSCSHYLKGFVCCLFLKIISSSLFKINFLKGSYFWSLGVIMNQNLWMQFSSESRVESWVPLKYVQESNHIHVRGLAVALEITVLSQFALMSHTSSSLFFLIRAHKHFVCKHQILSQ